MPVTDREGERNLEVCSHESYGPSKYLTSSWLLLFFPPSSSSKHSFKYEERSCLKSLAFSNIAQDSRQICDSMIFYNSSYRSAEVTVTLKFMLLQCPQYFTVFISSHWDPSLDTHHWLPHHCKHSFDYKPVKTSFCVPASYECLAHKVTVVFLHHCTATLVGINSL